MPDIGLVNYVRTSRSKGKSDEEITTTLRQNGQTEEQIQTIFATASGLVPQGDGAASTPLSTVIEGTASNFNPLKERYAGFGIRLGAHIIDALPFMLFTPIVPEYILALLFFIYSITMLTLYGSTIGKMLVGIELINDQRAIPSFGAVLFRETIGKTVSAILLIGYIMILFTRYKQGLHDIIAGTYVVYRK